MTGREGLQRPRNGSATLQNDSFGSFTETTKLSELGSRKKARWTPEELRMVASHPELTAQQVAHMLPGRTAEAVRNVRKRRGRNGKRGSLCCVCGERPVWRESPRAKEAGMCKGCWQDEEERRLDEERQANRIRQKRFKLAHGRGSR